MTMKTHQKQPDLLRNKRKAQKRRNVLISAGIAFVVLILVFTAMILPKLFTSKPDYKSFPGFYLGDPSAPISVVVFSNYSCGHCKVYSETLEKDIIADYVEKGYVYYRYVNLPYNNQQSREAAEASYCAAEQNMFFSYKALLYTYAAAADGFSTENLIKYAELVGLNGDKFSACMESDAFALAFNDDVSYAKSQKVPGTPTFLVNGELVTSNDLIATIEEFLVN